MALFVIDVFPIRIYLLAGAAGQVLGVETLAAMAE